MRSRKPIDSEAAAFARRAEQQIAALNKALKAMSDNMSGLHRGVRVPVPKGGSRYTKRTVSALSPFAAGGLAAFGTFAAGAFNDATGIGNYASSAQVASSWMSAFQKAQRIM
jgi:hypothetical protein